MTLLHKNLTGAQVHEPKGASGATSGTYYLADGASGGAWSVVYASTSDTSISSASNVEITGLSDYTDVVVELEGIAYDASGDLALTVGNSGGYATSYRWVKRVNTTDTVGSTDTDIQISTDLTTGTYYQSARIKISNFNKDKYSIFDFIGISSSDAGHTATSYAGFGVGRVEEEDAYDRLKITPSTGTLTGTAVRVFGLKGTSD